MESNMLFPGALTWAEVDPAQHPFDASEAYSIAIALIPKNADEVRRLGQGWEDLITVLEAVTGVRDGHQHFIQTVVRTRDPFRATTLTTALNQVRRDALAKAELKFELLCAWQRIVMETPDVCFRTHPAFAKGGRERYGIKEETQRCFECCLDEANSTNIPVLARAARVYLDVLFFHPFVDGNGRAATLTMDFVLAKENIVLDEVRPLFMVSRSPDSAGVHAFVRLLGVLTQSTRHRKPHKT